MEALDFRQRLTLLRSEIDRFLQRIGKKIKKKAQHILVEKEIIREADPDLEENLKEAYREWKLALEYFDNATEPELIDHASYLIGAAERKYMYLLRKKYMYLLRKYKES